MICRETITMDLGIWWKFGLILVVFASSTVSIPYTTCTPLLVTPGYTVPKGDIIIEFGNPLEIICVLNDEFAQKEETQNSTFSLTFVKNDQPVPSEFIQVINSTSIKLHIDKPAKVSNDCYTCMLNKDNKQTAVCENRVAVGVKPQLVDDFDCIGHNYDNLTCSWTLPQNYVDTNYSLTLDLGRASRMFDRGCPEIKYPEASATEQKATCFWDLHTNPHYRKAHPVFHFNLSMSNAFGTNHIIKTIMHYQHVLSGPPLNLTVLNTTSSSISLYWMVPYSMQPFPEGVHHRVLYTCEYCEKEFQLGGLLTDGKKYAKRVYFNLTGLKYAYMNYDIRVSLRSAHALPDDESMWSTNTSIVHRTASKIPDNPPSITDGTFEVIIYNNNKQYRDIYVYWRQLPEEQKNGAKFHYQIEVEDNELIQPVNITNTYAKYVNLQQTKSYKFNIWSVNEVGLSSAKATVYVPSEAKRINTRFMFTRVEFDEDGDVRKYQLNWEPPQLLSAANGNRITNYTIFWCGHERDRPSPCTGLLHWRTVGSDERLVNQTVPKDPKWTYHQFAISANTEASTSGMLWAVCSIVHNNGMIGKLQTAYVKSVGPSYIVVSWVLDCSMRVGTIEGYIINYCPSVPLQIACNGSEKSISIDGDSNLTSYNLTGLTPYTSYILTAAVRTKLGTSQESNHMYNTTLEAAPSTPVNFTYTDVTNSSVALKWLPPNATNGMITKYLIKYNNEVYQAGTNELSVNLTSLESYKNYLITIQACTMTSSCSAPSKALNLTTKIGYPSKIQLLNVNSKNETYFRISWSLPVQQSGNNLYELRIKRKYIDKDENKTFIYKTTNRSYVLDDCDDGGKFNIFYVSVRAVNKVNINGTERQFQGPWSSEVESYCRQTPVYFTIYIIMFVVIGSSIGMFFFGRKIYKRCLIMKDVEPKLPPGLDPEVRSDHTLVPWSSSKLQNGGMGIGSGGGGGGNGGGGGILGVNGISGGFAHNGDIITDRRRRLSADEEYLLVKMNDHRGAGDSGHESVTGSLESGTNLSNGDGEESSSDSGTDQPYNNLIKETYFPSPKLTTTTATAGYVLTGDVIPVLESSTASSKPYVACIPSCGDVTMKAVPSSPYVMTGDAANVVLKTTGAGIATDDSKTASTTPYISCDFTPPYVLTGDAISANTKPTTPVLMSSPSSTLTPSTTSPSPYVLTGDVNTINSLKSVNPGYIPFNEIQTNKTFK